MARVSSTNGAADEKTEVGLSLLGILAVTAAAYYTGQTGNWQPLMTMSIGLAAIVLFITSKK